MADDHLQEVRHALGGAFYGDFLFFVDVIFCFIFLYPQINPQLALGAILTLLVR